MPTLDFNGKQFIRGHHLTVPIRTLEIDNEKSFAGESGPSLDNNLIIHGDNLEALKALLPRYANSIKCIYIDPPYNTGNVSWKYNDTVNSPQMQAWLNKNVDAEDLERHDKWLCMMWPRLYLLHDLLSDDGVIFISIDDNEQHHLRMLMDEIFGEKNFIGTFLWKKKGTSTNTEGATVSPIADYQVCYRKFAVGSITPRITPKETRKYPHQDEQGNYRMEIIEKKNTGTSERKTMQFQILGKHPRDGKRWQIGEKTARKLEAKNRFIIHNGLVKKKIYDFEDKDTTSAHPTYLPESCGSSDSAEKNLTKILGNCGFETSKPVELVSYLLKLSSNSNDLILDSFAGSGTTAQAVLALNKEDGANRKFILIECEDYANDITAERVRRAINGVENAKDQNLKDGLGGSFTYCTLGDTINEIRILTDEPLPDYETVANYIAFVATGKREFTPIKKSKDYCFGETENILFYLIYEPKLAFMQSRDSALNYELARKIENTCKNADKKAYIYASHKNISQKDLTDMQITFCQLPYNIYRIKE